MRKSAALAARLRRGGVVVLDGAVGTELERRHVPTPAPLWSAAALDSHPQVVEAIHREYVEAGAEIIVANTFRTGPRSLRAAGMIERGEELNRLAIELARQATDAADKRALIAASAAPVEDCYSPHLVPEEAVLDEEHMLLMTWLRAAGPDLIWIETMNTLREARAAARAAAGVELPFVISFVLREDGELLGGERLEDAVAAVEPFEPLAIGLNCIPPAGITALLPRLKRAAARPVAAYAHINNRKPIAGWSYAQTVTPIQYAEHVRRWLDLGVRIIGGCCGTTPAHIRALVRGVPGR